MKNLSSTRQMEELTSEYIEWKVIQYILQEGETLNNHSQHQILPWTETEFDGQGREPKIAGWRRGR